MVGRFTLLSRVLLPILAATSLFGSDPLQNALLQPPLLPIADGSPNGYNYLQRGDWSVEFSIHGQRYRIVIPDGFISDGTTIPRGLWTLAGIERDGLERRASWLHDYLYKNQGNAPRLAVMIAGEWRGVSLSFTKSEADAIFGSLLIESGVTLTRAAIMYAAVLKYGQAAWDSHTPKK